MVDYEKRLHENTELFHSMVKLIPAGYYKMKDEDFIQSTKYFQNRKQKTSKEVHKEKIMNAKRKRLDPRANNDDPSLDSNGEESKTSINEEEEDGGGIDYSQVINIAAVKSLPLTVLRQRLRKKIEEMRAGRNADEQLQKAKRKDREQPKSKKSRVASRKPDSGDTSEVGGATEDAEPMIFNRFHINSTKKDKVKKKHGKKELEYLLKKAKDHKKKVEDIASVDAKKAEKVMENEKWKNAMSKASGIKKKDDPVLIQKSIKKIEKKKKHSSKEWKKRKDVQEEFKKKKQAKREHNIKERIERKKKRNAGKKSTNKKKK